MYCGLVTRGEQKGANSPWLPQIANSLAAETEFEYFLDYAEHSA